MMPVPAASLFDLEQESDPLHDPDYREAFLHVDGSITEKVLMMLQDHNPVSAGVSLLA